MTTKEFITPFGTTLYLPNTVYTDFVKKFKELKEKQPDSYNLENGKEIINQWFPKASPEEVVRELYADAHKGSINGFIDE